MIDIVEAKRNWGLEPSDLQVFSSADTHRLVLRTDPMDDTVSLTVAILATSSDDPRMPPGLPCLLFTIRRRGLWTYLQTYASFPDRFFYRRGKGKSVRIRIDSEPALTCREDDDGDISLCTIEWPMPYVRLVDAAILRIQITPGIGAGLVSTYNLGDARTAVEVFLKAAFGESYREIAALHPRIVESVSCFGPKNTVLKKQALTDLGFFKGAINETKAFDLYKAVNSFAVDIQSFEILGTAVDLKTGRLHEPVMSAIYNKARPELKAKMGPLKMSE